MARHIGARKRRDGASINSAELEARYANYFEVGHNAFEFIVDFGQYQREVEGVRMHYRIVTGPVYAKLLTDLLRSAVERFEAEHGEIQPASDDLDPIEVVQQSIAGYDRRPSPSPKNAKQRGSTP